MSTIRPLRRFPMLWVTPPTPSSGRSQTRSSIGSWTSPSTVLRTGSGFETVSSYPSRRMFSTITASWSSPRPTTLKASGVSVSSTRIETFR